ncbi:MAG: DUF3419 family protein [Rhizobiaceae bacterium]|nr:DUF3419 family protein [Rhizobiaceae bacterium]
MAAIETATRQPRATHDLVSDALAATGETRALSVGDRIFARLFTGLVYPMIWEDPDADMAALDLAKGERIVTIASGGCNWLAYCERGPASIDAVDLNAHHVALSRLKRAVYASLLDDAAVAAFFGSPGQPGAISLYDRFIAPALDNETRAYWNARDKLGRRRIAVFERNIHRTGLLGRFIAFGHAIARLNGVDPAVLLKAKSLEEQKALFDTHIAPIFYTQLVKLGTRLPVSLFGLGIPPAQYEALLEGRSNMADVLKERTERLACGHALKDNYFAWMAFARRFPEAHEGAPPPALDPVRLPAIRTHVECATIHHANLRDVLAAKPASSVDCFILLDAQDWMDDATMNRLWAEIDRTASDNARVLFRTAGAASVIEGRVSLSVLGRWMRDEAASAHAFAADRSAIYGGVHLYRRRA